MPVPYPCEGGQAKLWRDVVCWVVLLVFALTYTAFAAASYPVGVLAYPGPGLVPVLAGAALTAVSALVLAWTIRSRCREPLTVATKSASQEETDPRALTRVAVILASAVFYVAFLRTLGYLITCAVTVFTMVWVMQRNRPVRLGLVALGVTLVTWWLFRFKFLISLPQGAILPW